MKIGAIPDRVLVYTKMTGLKFRVAVFAGDVRFRVLIRPLNWKCLVKGTAWFSGTGTPGLAITSGVLSNILTVVLKVAESVRPANPSLDTTEYSPTGFEKTLLKSRSLKRAIYT